MAAYYRGDRFCSISPGTLLFKKPKKNKSEPTVSIMLYLKYHYQQKKKLSYAKKNKV